MARRQLYDDVMDVALRATLEKNGFSRKTRRDYVREQPDRMWYFELEMAPDPWPGFEATATVFLPELDAIMEKYAPGIGGLCAERRNHAHISASIPELMQVAAGHDFYTSRRGPASRNWSEAQQRAQSDPVMEYQQRGFWVLPQYAYELNLDLEEERHRLRKGRQELGLFLDEQWRIHALAWYFRCNDPLFVVNWIETDEFYSDHYDISAAVLCHMAGDNGKAASYLQRRFEDARLSYDEIYKNFYKRQRGNWFQRVWAGGYVWTEERVAAEAKAELTLLANLAKAGRNLAAGLGISGV